jgi:hypothetical protein
MNNLKFLSWLVCAISFSFTGLAQPIQTAHIKYEMSINADGQEEMKQMASLMGNSIMDVYFTEWKQRVDMSMMGGMIVTKMFYDKQMNKSIMLQEMMGQKFKIKLDDQKIQDSKRKDSDSPKLSPKVTLDKKDRKKIQGYDCYKATAAIENNGQKVLITCYITDQINSPHSIIKEADEISFGGFPLEYTLDMATMKILVTAKEIDKNVNSSIFEVPTSGYKEMTLEEFTHKMGGAGLGF